MMKATHTFFILALIVLGSACQSQSSNTEVVTVIDQPTFEKMVSENSSPQLVDIRTPEEYAEGKIGEAININFFDDNFMAQMEKSLDKNATVIIYCKSGGRSGKASKKLEAAGFSAVYDLGCGYSGWKKK